VVVQGPCDVTASPTLLGVVEPAGLPEIAVEREVFRVLVELLTPRPSREEKASVKIVDLSFR